MRSSWVCSLSSTPSAFSEARSEAVACPVAQMPQMRLVMCEASGIGPAAQHGLEEARRLDDVEPAFFQHAVGDFDDDVAVAFDAGYVMYIDALIH